MAAIIAQLSRANWERKKNIKKQIPSDKSNIFLPPFDERFVAEVHNKHLRLKRKTQAKRRAEKLDFVEEVLESAKGKNLLDDRLDLLARNLDTVRRRKSRTQQERRRANWVDAFRAAAGFVFLAIFLVVFVVLLAIFYSI